MAEKFKIISKKFQIQTFFLDFGFDLGQLRRTIKSFCYIFLLNLLRRKSSRYRLRSERKQIGLHDVSVESYHWTKHHMQADATFVALLLGPVHTGNVSIVDIFIFLRYFLNCNIFRVSQ